MRVMTELDVFSDWRRPAGPHRRARRAVCRRGRFAVAGRCFELSPISFDGKPVTVSVAELMIDVAREPDESRARL
jgi:hypothetical protein